MAKPLVVIDPGHGGKDPGAVAHGLAEKDVVLRLGRMVREELAAYDVDVRMTRDSDRFVELSDRAALANKWGAALFVSLHNNAGGGQGFESYIHPNAKAATATIQNVIHGEVMAYLRGYGITDRGKKRANLAVCRETRMPAVLLENLFIDHPRENGLLRDEAFLRGLAASIASGIAKALGLRRKAASPTASKVTQAASQKPAAPPNAIPVYVNGQYVGQGMLIEERTFVPVRLVAEALGAKVTWDAKTKSVHIQK